MFNEKQAKEWETFLIWRGQVLAEDVWSLRDSVEALQQHISLLHWITVVVVIVIVIIIPDTCFVPSSLQTSYKRHLIQSTQLL